MPMTDPILMSALVAMGVGVLMVRAGVGKGLLAWRKNDTDRRRKRRVRQFQTTHPRQRCCLRSPWGAARSRVRCRRGGCS
jgi:hypothetical protein